MGRKESNQTNKNQTLCLVNNFNMYTKCPLNETLANSKTHMRDARECINSIGYVLFAVIKAIFSNRYDFDLIMNYVQTIV